MKSSVLLFLALTIALAAPVVPPNDLLPRHQTRILRRQQTITQPVSFQTVETSQTQVGTIVQTCTITLTPIPGGGGAIREDKECIYLVQPPGQSPPLPPPLLPPSSNSGGGTSDSVVEVPNDGSTTGSATQTSTQTSTTVQASATGSSSTSSSASATNTAAAPPPRTLVATTPAAGSSSPAPTASATGSTSAGANTSAPPDSPSTTPTPVTVTSTLSDGSLTTLVTTPAQAQASAQQQEEVPGRKLEVLPIGLGVFAGISVIALIVVGLVTYERTKYRRAFRQRKMAEAGANMGYGGMAERT